MAAPRLRLMGANTAGGRAPGPGLLTGSPALPALLGLPSKNLPTRCVPLPQLPVPVPFEMDPALSLPIMTYKPHCPVHFGISNLVTPVGMDIRHKRRTFSPVTLHSAALGSVTVFNLANLVGRKSQSFKSLFPLILR